jgi:hypothetical protein
MGGITVLYSQTIDPKDLSKWDKTGNVIYPKNFATENVAIGINTDTGGGNTFKFVVIQGAASIGLLDNASPLKGIQLTYDGATENQIQINQTQIQLKVLDLGVAESRIEISPQSVLLQSSDLGIGDSYNLAVNNNAITLEVPTQPLADLIGLTDLAGVGTAKLIIKAFDDDAAAGLAGYTTGYIYQTTGAGAAPLNIAGIVMVKQ